MSNNRVVEITLSDPGRRYLRSLAYAAGTEPEADRLDAAAAGIAAQIITDRAAGAELLVGGVVFFGDQDPPMHAFAVTLAADVLAAWEHATIGTTMTGPQVIETYLNHMPYLDRERP